MRLTSLQDALIARHSNKEPSSSRADSFARKVFGLASEKLPYSLLSDKAQTYFELVTSFNFFCLYL